MRDYDLGIVVTPEAGEEQVKALVDRVSQLVVKNGGQIVKVNSWGRRKLAYPINRHRDGYYVFVDMQMSPSAVSELERNLKVSEEVLRHLIVVRDPKAIAQERARAEQAAAQAAAAPVPTPAPEAATPATEEVAPVVEEATPAAEEAPKAVEEDVPAAEEADETSPAAEVEE